MKRFLLFLLILFLVIEISGCTLSETCVLYNNTGQNLKVIQQKIEGTKSERKLKAHSTIRLGGWVWHTYQVVTKDTIWNYNPIRPDYDFFAYGGFDQIFKAQLEKDGRIYILRPDQSFPASEFPKQPEGFPLLPK